MFTNKNNPDTFPTIGAGNYGLVVRSDETSVWKLFKQLDEPHAIHTEATIQTAVYNLCTQFCPEVNVPNVTQTLYDIIRYKQTPYLNGIAMNYLQPPNGFETQVHTLLGYRDNDLDTEWGMRTAYPVSETNPTRGFFASPTTLEMIWEEEGSNMTVEQLAYTMGKAYRLMIVNGIVPIDIEWVWSNGRPWMIDFGLCEFGTVDPEQFYHSKTSRGLRYDCYIPHEGDRGHEDFYRGYFDL